MSTPPPPNPSMWDNLSASPITPTREMSKNFRAGDADVTFVSSDNILFYLHRKNLETHAAAFPPAEFETRGEIVPLTEDGPTLELLFQFIYPQRYPDLGSTTFEVLAPLAEAAEKYEVFSAMSICKIHMKTFLPNHATDIFNYASKHDYRDILELAAPFLLDIPLDELVTTLSLELIRPWVRYREHWNRAAFAAIAVLPSACSLQGDQTYCNQCYTYLSGFHPSRLWVSLGEKRSRESLEGLYKSISYNNHCSHTQMAPLCTKLDEELQKVPSFLTYL